MLIEFSVANYRSFKERVTLSMEAESRLSERDKSVDMRNIAHTPHGDLLRVAGIYGANASGKSNLVRALFTLKWLVLGSTRGQDGDPIPAEPFRLDEATVGEPSEMEVVYAEDGRQVRYGAAFTRERITHEWLFVRPIGSDEEIRWFERRFDPSTRKDTYETGGAWERVEAFERATRKEALHVSTASQLENAEAKAILDWFRGLHVINGLVDGGTLVRTMTLLEGPNHGEAIRKLVRQLDFGIDDIDLAEVDEKAKAMASKLVRALASTVQESVPLPELRVSDKRITTTRRGVTFELTEESAGTARAIALAGPVVEALAKGHTMVVDEFDARLHTLLAKQIVELFQDCELNPRNAQLIFASHDTNLLTRTLLRRDQIWFVEKSHKTQASDLYSLAEIRLDGSKRVRNDARYEDDYLQGRYGAIPFFGNLQALLGDALARAGNHKE